MQPPSHCHLIRRHPDKGGGRPNLMTQWPVYDLCPASSLNLGVCLHNGGQSFTWIPSGEQEWY